MRILRLDLDRFGILKGRLALPRDRALLLVDDNEAGKSTFIAALYAGLFGIAPGNTREGRSFQSYRPESGPWTLRILVETRGRSYVVERDLEQRSLTVHDDATGMERTAEFLGRSRDRFGSWATGMAPAAFLKSALLRQARGVVEEEWVEEGGGLRAALQAAADSEAGETPAAQAIARIQEGRDDVPRVTVKAGRGKVVEEIRSLERQREAIDRTLADLEAEREAVGERVGSLETLRAGLQSTREAARRAECYRLLAEAADLEERLERDDRLGRRIEELGERMTGLEGDAGFPVERRDEVAAEAARFESAEAELVSREAERREAEEKLDVVERGLADREGFQGAEAEDAERAALRADRLVQATGRLEAVEAEILRERRRLDEAGLSPVRFERIEERRARLDPEEVRFLLSLPGQLGEIDQRVEEAREDLLHSEEELATLVRRRRWALPPLLAGVLSLGVGGGLLLAEVERLSSGFLIAGGLLLLVAGALFLSSGPRRRPRLQARVRGFDQRAAERRREAVVLRQRAERLAVEAGYDEPTALAADLNLLERWSARLVPLRSAVDRRARLLTEKEEATGELAEEFRRVGRRVPDRLGVEEARALVRDYSRVSELQGRRRELCRIHERLEREEDRSRREASRAAERLQELGRVAGLEADCLEEGPAAIAERFAARADERVEYDRLRDERAGLEAGRLSETDRREAEDTLTRYRERAARLAAELGEAAPSPERGSAAMHAAESERQEIRQRELERRERELLVELGAHLERYERRFPELARERAETELRLERARRFDRATQRAMDELDALSRETYADWSRVLNARAGRVLARLGPGHGELRFDEDLGFSVVDPSGRRHSAEQVRETFSYGTREQVHLAVRIALGEYLSRDGDPLPLILDDPLTGADDSRFENALSFLLEEIASERQLILLSCHRMRHETVLEKRPGLASRVEIRNLAGLRG